jgi:light-regulated signal transduction histidine kinase (bacteriophytochrome)
VVSPTEIYQIALSGRNISRELALLSPAQTAQIASPLLRQALNNYWQQVHEHMNEDAWCGLSALLIRQSRQEALSAIGQHDLSTTLQHVRKLYGICKQVTEKCDPECRTVFEPAAIEMMRSFCKVLEKSLNFSERLSMQNPHTQGVVRPNGWRNLLRSSPFAFSAGSTITHS